MSIYQYNTEQKLPIPIQKAWEFFSSPMNLARITPPSMDFKVLSSLDSDKIYSGMKISYSVKPLMGIPVNWETLIAEVNEPFSFADTQITGPYTLWEHTHAFSEIEGGVLMRDSVRYKLPFGIIGNLAHFVFVRRKIEAIFEYRFNTLNKLFA